MQHPEKESDLIEREPLRLADGHGPREREGNPPAGGQDATADGELEFGRLVRPDGGIRSGCSTATSSDSVAATNPRY